MKKDNKRKRGFTLIELLAVIIVLGIVVSVSIYVSVGLINKKDDKVKFINTEAEYKSVLAYATEFKKTEDYQSYVYDKKSFRYVCVKMKDLVDKGYLDGDKIDPTKEVIVIRNSNGSYVPFSEYEGSINKDYCNKEVINDIQITAITQPKGYSDGTWYDTDVKTNITVTSNRNNSVTKFSYGIGNNLKNEAYIKDGVKEYVVKGEGKDIKLKVKALDMITHKSFFIDKTKPHINNISDFAYSNGSITKFKLTYDENLSGLYKIYVSTNSSAPDPLQFKSISIDSYGYVTPEGFTINNPTTYYVWIMDKAGNISDVKSFNYDNEKPKLVYNWDYTNGQCGSSYPMWRRNDRDIKLAFSDNVAVKSYKITNTSTNSVVSSKDFGTNGVQSYNTTVNLTKGNYRIEVKDINGLSYSTTVSPPYLDNEGPILDYDYSTFDYDCGYYDVGYNFYVEWYDAQTLQLDDAYFKITTSRSKPSSGWKRFSYEYNLDLGETYYLYLKFDDVCGNSSVYRYASFSCDGGGSSGGDDDCHKVCLMYNNSTDWHFSTGYTGTQTKLHAINSIIAGELSFGVSYDNVAGTWYKGGTKLYTWYNNNCRGTTCGNTSLEVNKSRYSSYIINGYSSCTNYNSSYVSGYCASNSCYCCPIGTGFYGGDCYRYYSE